MTSSGTPTPAPASYRDLPPLEQGGRTAREGFAYQDHITVTKCLDMLGPEGPSEVWCEAEDDIVLVWGSAGSDEFEFVQVKGTDLNQAWTVAKLCAAAPSKNGDAKKPSIVERSLLHDRGAEPCRFRIITTWQPDMVLRVLCAPLAARSAQQLVAALAAAATALETQLEGPRTSPNGNGLASWVTRTTWEHRASSKDVQNENLVKLHNVLDRVGESLAPDQCEELYRALYAKVQDAAIANAATHKVDKRILREELRQWVLARVKTIQHPTHSGSCRPLVSKLEEAGFDAAVIEGAKDLRRRYAADARMERYLDINDRDAIEGEIVATLNALRVSLDAGKFADNGREFLERCQDSLRAMRDSMDGPRVPDRFLYGCMFEIMNRCIHRLARPKP